MIMSKLNDDSNYDFHRVEHETGFVQWREGPVEPFYPPADELPEGLEVFIKAMRGLMDGIKWGEDLERDCRMLKDLEKIGIYPTGYHDHSCPLEHEEN